MDFMPQCSLKYNCTGERLDRRLRGMREIDKQKMRWSGWSIRRLQGITGSKKKKKHKKLEIMGKEKKKNYPEVLLPFPHHQQKAKCIKVHPLRKCQVAAILGKAKMTFLVVTLWAHETVAAVSPALCTNTCVCHLWEEPLDTVSDGEGAEREREIKRTEKEEKRINEERVRRDRSRDEEERMAGRFWKSGSAGWREKGKEIPGGIL